MVNRDDIIKNLNEYLKINEINDYCPNGLQVEGSEQVTKIITSVSASLELFEIASAENAEMIIVHHGILWHKDSPVVKGTLKNRLVSLLSSDITLLAYHLPLDMHPEVGNNILAAQGLGLEQIQPLGKIGVKGITQDFPVNEFITKVDSFYRSKSLVFEYGPAVVNKVGICSGGGEHDITLAIEDGLHIFISGEAGEPTMHLAKEGNIHFLAAGHYATERLGITVLGSYLTKTFDVKVQFIDLPNPV